MESARPRVAEFTLLGDFLQGLVRSAGDFVALFERQVSEQMAGESIWNEKMLCSLSYVDSV
ncbi:hypothetical protein QHI69_32725 [Burkholderia gladioli pv. gladioli]|uniref:hypothetical protein n=1 Tax=Burkholderia gladioli TaxID=28095 RepID=UPI000AE03C94|nr:hypothetical protein [Burkholderia gladioli]MDJ1166676.1 hypothetical protein [Burkholderia gladioli pv. gladioli]